MAAFVKCTLATLLFCLSVRAQEPSCPVIHAPYQENIVVDGDGADWRVAPALRHLTEFWAGKIEDSTALYLCHDRTNLYFLFDFVDRTMTCSYSKRESSVETSDRVELFFSRDFSMKEYYCAEMSPTGTVLDYKAHYYRKLLYGWDMRVLRIATRLNGSHALVEGRIPLRWLRSKGLLQPDGRMILGVFRGDYSADAKAEPRWWSWIDPKTPTPDFHVPASLGLLKLD